MGTPTRMLYGALLATTAIAGCVFDNEIGEAESEVSMGLPGELEARNEHGVASSYSPAGPIDQSNPFFQPLGSNDRSCVTCHDPRSGWNISRDLARRLFRRTDGLDALFLLHDVGTRPDAPIATEEERREAFRPMVERGLVRFTTTVPATAEFEVLAVDDPYGFGTPASFTRFRRSLALASEAQQASVTWTGGPHDVPTQLRATFNGATLFHGQGTVPVPEEIRQEAAGFMLSVYHAQSWDDRAGRLDDGGARGGPVHLAGQEFFIGINSGDQFDPKVFDLFDAWRRSHKAARRRIYRGQEVFNFKQFAGTGTCGGCHNTPNVGGSSTFRMLAIGTDEPTAETAEFLPHVTIRNKATGEVRVVTDLGRATVTGLWNDLGRYKVPMLRGLASRAPYFHDGRAETIEEVVEHYESRFDIDFVGTERGDLIAFLAAL